MSDKVRLNYEQTKFIKYLWNDSESGNDCHFSEYNEYGDAQKCWFIPSPTNCTLCLMGQQKDVLVEVTTNIKDILEELKK